MATSLAADFFVEIADYERDLDALRAVREPVFVVEQQVPLELEWDELDPLSRHVVARDTAGRPIGTGRLTPERKVGRMAVLPEWRGRGVGAAMLTTLIDLARERGYRELSLHAQVDAIDFYRRAGFEPYGERFMEAGIEHQSMRRTLEPLAAPVRPAPAPVPAGEEREFATFIECRAALLDILRDARRGLWIYSRDLDPGLLGDPDAIEELRRIGLSGRGADIRLLVQEPTAAQQARSGLIPLLQRMSSAVQLRQPVDEVDLQYPSAFVANDRGGYWFRPLGSRFEGYANRHAPGMQRQLLDYFRQVWERAALADELRQMRL
jgi:predicted GNAT family N-acyltransferase